MTRFRPNAGIASSHDQKQVSESSATLPRQIKWDIDGEMATYTCNDCAWKFTFRVSECSEPMKRFDEHNCADYPAEPPVDS
jgi:hypothetical protein